MKTHAVIIRKLVLRCAFILGLLSFLLFDSHAQNATNAYWQGQSIYQIITDRFYDGDPSNNNAEGNYNPSNMQSVHGGDFAGIQQKLEYLKSLGVTAIWISPIIQNTESQFHGYSGMDFTKVAPHWGTLSNLQVMVQAAHAKGILVILDIVVNHGGDLVASSGSTYNPPPGGYTLSYVNSSKTYPAPFNLSAANPSLTNLWHNYGNIGNFNDLTQTQLGWLSGLNDFRTESVYVRTNMANVYENWIGQVGFDGFRIDTTYEVEPGFWQSWCPAVHAYAASNGLPNFFMFGEIFSSSESLVGSYTGTMGGGAFEQDSALDYPLYFAMNSVFASASGNTKQIENHYTNLLAYYDPSAQYRTVTFLDNHDNPRFLSSSEANGNTNRLIAALEFLYSSRGIPCLYYGTEQGFNGTTDPNDREDMFGGQFKDGPASVDSFNMTHPLFQLVAMLNNFRRLYPAMSLGTHINLWNTGSGPGLFAYSRRLGGQELFVAFNTASSSQTLTNRSTIYPAGTVLANLLNTNETITILAGPVTPQVTIPSMTVKLFMAQNQLQPLDPVVVSNSPAHAATGFPTWMPIVLQFSRPMDTNTVQSAFGITPFQSGTFSWSPAQDTMTFTPTSANGLTPLTNFIVRVTNSAADSVTGKTLYGGYELKFSTAAFSAHDLVPPSSSITSPSNNSVVSGTVVVSGTASDNLAVQSVLLKLDGGAWNTATGTSNWTFTLPTTNLLNGPHVLSETAVDSSSNYSTTNVLNLRFVNIPGAYLARMSGGNPSNVVDCTGTTWLKDAAYSLGGFGYSGGTAGVLSNTISNTCASAQSLYQREHYSTSSAGFYYYFDCPIGIYETTILEAETYWSAVAKREFNFFIQGNQLLTNYDIFAAAGGQNRPITLVFTNAVTNSQLQLLFTPVIDNARVSGVQAKKIGDVFSDTDGIPDWWRLAYFGHALGSAADLSRGTDDADGDGTSNLAEYLAGTDPLNALSVFKITKVVPTSTNALVSWTTTTNHNYQLQRRTTLDASTGWSNISSALPANGGVVTQTDPNPATNTTQFYRVMVQ